MPSGESTAPSLQTLQPETGPDTGLSKPTEQHGTVETLRDPEMRADCRKAACPIQTTCKRPGCRAALLLPAQEQGPRALGNWPKACHLPSNSSEGQEAFSDAAAPPPPSSGGPFCSGWLQGLHTPLVTLHSDSRGI